MKRLMLRKLLCAVLVANLITIKSGCSQPTPVPNGSIIHEATPLEKRPKKLTGSWRLPDSR